jgi:uncharacterized membrane protein
MSETKTSTGLDQNIAGLLCYVLGFITGLIFILIEKENKFVRFHAFQSLFTFLGLWVIQFVLMFIPILGWLLAMVLALVGLVVWILMMIKAFQGHTTKLPIVGDLAAKQAGLV